ncbi:MAG: hypothetical protein ACYDBV_12535 [Nitrospiria bacterium]
MKSFFIGVLVLTMMVFSSARLDAAEDHTLENIFKDSYYGAALGGLLGAAIMVFTDRPADHLNYIAYGLAGGVIAGTVYGMTAQARSFAEVDRGKLVLDLPYPEVKSFPRLNPAEREKRVLSLSFLRYRF